MSQGQICQECGGAIISRNKRKFCCVPCYRRWRKKTGFYQRILSPAGNKQQIWIKQQTGHAPGYGSKKPGISISNSINPRRKPRSQSQDNSTQ